MMVSQMPLNDLTTMRRSDGARCSIRVLDGMCSQMAQPSTSAAVTSSLVIDRSSSSDESGDSPPLSPNQSDNELPSTSQPHPMFRMHGQLYAMDDFDRRQLLGEGFFSKVFKVAHRVTGEVMVLKVGKSCSSMDSRRAAHADTAREAAMMKRLQHPNVLALKGACVEITLEGQWDMHLLVDYCGGGSLSQLILDRTKRFPWQQRAKYALDIAKAMEYIHGEGIIHRDLTSMNVLLQDQIEGSRAVVADFGLSCRFPKQGERLPQVGTTYFMSPECLKEEFYDEKSDVFSFGVIMCQLIARIEADPDSGLHRTSIFGLDYVLFTPCCPPDTPMELLKLAFRSCVLDPISRPPFDEIVKILSKMSIQKPASPQMVRENKESRGLGRSRSDAALKKPRGMAASRKLSSHINVKPVIEGQVDDSYMLAMEELARDVAREDPAHDHTNPFMDHERFRKERKIIPRKSGRRRSETKPEQTIGGERVVARINRRRWSSLPSEMDSPHLTELSEEEDVDETDDAIPGGIPMLYRDFDRNFTKQMKRFPSRRHTLIPECSAAKSSLELSQCLREDEKRRSKRRRAVERANTTNDDEMSISRAAQPVFAPLTLSPLVEVSPDMVSSSLKESVISSQPVSTRSSTMSSCTSSCSPEVVDHLNNNPPHISWDDQDDDDENVPQNQKKNTVIVSKPKRNLSSRMCSPTMCESKQRRNTKSEKCSIL